MLGFIDDLDWSTGRPGCQTPSIFPTDRDVDRLALPHGAYADVRTLHRSVLCLYAQ